MYLNNLTSECSVGTDTYLTLHLYFLLRVIRYCRLPLLSCGCGGGGGGGGGRGGGGRGCGGGGGCCSF